MPDNPTQDPTPSNRPLPSLLDNAAYAADMAQRRADNKFYESALEDTVYALVRVIKHLQKLPTLGPAGVVKLGDDDWLDMRTGYHYRRIDDCTLHVGHNAYYGGVGEALARTLDTLAGQGGDQ